MKTIKTIQKIKNTLILLLLLFPCIPVSAQLSADNDGNIQVSPLNGVLRYSYPISNNSVDGYPIKVQVNYVSNVLNRQYLNYVNTPDEQYWNTVSVLRPGWIMGVNGFAINMFKSTEGFISDKHYHDFVVEGFDYCNRMGSLENIEHTDVIRILKDDGSVLELRNQKILSWEDWNDARDYTGKYYEVGLNPSGYGIVEYNSETELNKFYSDTVYKRMENYKYSRMNEFKSRTLKYYQGDGLEYVFKEYVIPYGVKFFDNSYNTSFPGSFPTIFYLEEINSSEKSLVKFKRDGHNYSEKSDSLFYGRAVISEFANHKVTIGSTEAKIEVFDKTYTFLFKPAMNEKMYDSLVQKNRRYSYYLSDSLKSPNTKEYFVKTIVDPYGREVNFGYQNNYDTEDFIKIWENENEIINYFYDSWGYKNQYLIPEYTLKPYNSNYTPDGDYTNYINAISDNSKLILFNYQNIGLNNQIIYGSSSSSVGIDSNRSNSVKSIRHYERKNNDLSLIKEVNYKFQRNIPSIRTSSMSMHDKITDKRDTVFSEYQLFSANAYKIDNSYINPQNKFSEFLPVKVTYRSKYLQPNSQSEYVEETNITKTSYARSDSSILGGYSRLYFYPIKVVDSLSIKKSGGSEIIPPMVHTKEMKYTFDTLNFLDYGNQYYAQVVKSDSTIVYEMNSNIIKNKHVTNYKNYNYRKAAVPIMRNIYNSYQTSQAIDRARIDGGNVADVPPVYTNLLIDYQTFPFISGLIASEYLLDNKDTILAGKKMVYQDELFPLNGRRGSILQDSIIIKDGKNGKGYLNAEYIYHSISKLLVGTKQANGAISRQYYNYTEANNGLSDIVTGKMLKNNSQITPIEFKKLDYNYETPIATEAIVRDANGQSHSLKTYFKKTKFGMNAGIIDANGWLSGFKYDANGRMNFAWLPFDFPVCSSLFDDYDDSTIPLVDKKTKVKKYIDVIDPKSKCITRDDHYYQEEYDYSGTNIGTSTMESYSSDSSTIIQKVYKSSVSMSYEAGGTDAFHNGTGLKSAFLKMQYTGDYNKSTMLRINSNVGGFEKTIMLSSAGLNNSVSNANLPQNATTPMLRVDISSLINTFSQLRPGEKVEFIIESMDNNSKLELLQFSEDSRSVIETESLFNPCPDSADFTLKIEYNESKGNRSMTSLRKIDDPGQQVNSMSSKVSNFESMERQGRYGANKSYYGYNNRNIKNETLITSYNNMNPLTSDQLNVVNLTHSGYSQLLTISDSANVKFTNEYNNNGELIAQKAPDNTKKKMYSEYLNPESMGNTTNINFYGACLRKTIINEIGITTQEYYDAYGQLRMTVNNATGTDELKQKTKYEYDLKSGNLLKVIKPDNSVTCYEYDKFNRVIKKTDPIAGISKCNLDDIGRVRYTQDAVQLDSNKLSYYQYDDLGRPTVIGEAKITTNFDIYGLNSNLLAITSNSNLYNTVNPTIYTTSSVITPDINVNNYRYTSYFPKMQFKLEFSGQYITHDTKAVSNIRDTSAILGNFENIAVYPQFVRIVNQYDKFPTKAGAVWGKMPDKKLWDSLVANHEWDKNDSLVRSIRNLKGRKSAVAYRDNYDQAFHYIVYSYDPRGRVQSLMRYTENLGFDAVHYKYNSSNQITETMTIDPQKRCYTWYSYDNNGRVDSVWTKLTDTTTAGCGYGANVAMKNMTINKSGKSDLIYFYNTRGGVDSVKYSKLNYTQQFVYSVRGWVDSIIVRNINKNIIFKQELQRDSAGSIYRQLYWNQPSSPKIENYSYDELSRLAHWENENESVDYQYDIMGNREIVTMGNNGTNYFDFYTYNQNGTLKNYGYTTMTKSYEYNLNGSTKSIIDASQQEYFKYNFAGLVSEYQKSINDEIWKYRYSPLGGREQKKQIKSTIGNSGEYKIGTDVYKKFYSWNYYLLGADGSQMAVYRGVQTKDTIRFIPEYYSAAGGTICMLPDSKQTLQYNFLDHLGSMRMRVSLDKNNMQSIEYFNYKPFGDTLNCTKDAKTGKIGYIGNELDEENNYFLLGARQYDKNTGRFLSVDPLWESFPNYNPFHYCYNNPISFKDPTGLAPEKEKGDELLVRDPIWYRLANPLEPGIKWSDIYGRWAFLRTIKNAMEHDFAIYRQNTEAMLAHGQLRTSDGGSGGGHSGGSLPPIQVGDKLDPNRAGQRISDNGSMDLASLGTGNAAEVAADMNNIFDTEYNDSKGKSWCKIAKAQYTIDNTYTPDNPNYFCRNYDAYNCFSDAWFDGKGDPQQRDEQNPYWDDDGVNNEQYGRKLNPGERVLPGDIVEYYAINSQTDNYELVHAATVMYTNNQGLAIAVRSKAGMGPMVIHHPRDIELWHGAFGSPLPFIFHQGIRKPSRVYYRKTK